MKHIAIFASGKGSNAEAIIRRFKDHPAIKVVLVLTNNPGAGVLKIAAANNIISTIVTQKGLNNEPMIMGMFQSLKVDFIVLAGFLKLVPKYLLEKFPNKIVNIHPALLPKHGGKGMYGMKVHEAVLAGGDKETGITIHYVNENYDEGEVILQKKLVVEPTDKPETIALKIHQLEHVWYPKTIEKLLS